MTEPLRITSPLAHSFATDADPEPSTAEGQAASKPNRWYLDKAAAEAACFALPCDLALRAAELKMPNDGLAEKMLEHFLSGSSAPVRVDLTAELQRNAQLREYVSSRIEADLATKLSNDEPVQDMTGAVWIPQHAYGESDAGKDQRLALGGTYFEYQVVGNAANGGLEVKLNVSDHYFWSPSDAARATQCLHECGASLVAKGKATEFYQVGEGRIVVANPAITAPMKPLEVEVRDDG
jgi:hypothetical protein